MKHTPGPWKVVATPGRWTGVAPDGTGPLICTLVENNLANADMIAAAPEMWELLADIRRDHAVSRADACQCEYCEFVRRMEAGK